MPSLVTDSWDDIQKWFGLNGETTANTAGMNPTQAKVAGTAATLSNAGTLLSIFGGLNSAIGSYYAAKSAQYQEQSQASSLQFKSNMDAINASQAELSAQSIEQAGQSQVEQYTMRAGQEAASTQVGTAARGVDLTSGSAMAQRASDALVKDMDVLTINANTTRAAWGQRTAATNDKSESLLEGVSAQNLKSSADTISPAFSATSSLLSSATGLASRWDYRRQFQMASMGGT